MNILILPKKVFYFKLIFSLILLHEGSFNLYSQNKQLNNDSYKDIEFVIITDFYFKIMLESTVNSINYCDLDGLVWYLNENKGITSISLVIQNTILTDSIFYITFINNHIVYIGNIDKKIKMHKTSIKFHYQERDDIFFQDFASWFFIKIKDNYVLKKSIKNCN